MDTSYYIEGLLRQANAAYARAYLGIGTSDVLTVGYVVNTIPLWNDNRIPMSSLRTGAAAPSAQNFVGTIRAYQFRNGFTERLEFELQAPHGFNESATYGLRLHVHWSCNSATTPNTVGWKVDATVSNIAAPAGFSAPVTYGPATGLTTVANEHVITPIHTFTGLTDSALIVGNIYRDIGDTYAGNDVFGLSIDAHYVIEKSGSLDEFGD